MMQRKWRCFRRQASLEDRLFERFLLHLDWFSRPPAARVFRRADVRTLRGTPCIATWASDLSLLFEQGLTCRASLQPRMPALLAIRFLQPPGAAARCYPPPQAA